MTTTNTRLGANSFAVSYTSGTSAADLLTAVITALVAQGWTVFDAAAGANAQCLRTPIADGTMAYKYMVVDTNGTNLLSKVYESWNATTHAGTNLAYYSDVQYNAQRLSLSAGGIIWIFATSRYAIFYSRTATGAYGSDNYSSFSGCVEFSRDNADETPGTYPSFGWVGGGQMIGVAANTGALNCFSPPRGITGAVAASVCGYASISTPVGRTSTNGSSNVALGSLLPGVANPLSASGNLFAFTPTYVECATSTPNYATSIRGRLYGIKILGRYVGLPGETINIKTDSSLFADNGSGSSIVSHMIVSESNYAARFAIPL